MRHTILLVAAVATLAACAESPTQMTDLEVNFARSGNSHGRVVGSASGSGHSLCSPDGIDCRPEVGGETLTERYDLDERDLALRTFSFNVELYADGTARGQAQYNNRGLNQAWDVDVECVYFRPDKPNQAWMQGTLTRGYGQAASPGGIPYAPGARVSFAVEDNGEGPTATAPDRIIGFGTVSEGQYQNACTAPESVPLGLLDFFMGSFGFDPIRGNIQVRAPSAD